MKEALRDNKYHQVLIAAQRARQLEKGARPRVSLANMKVTSIALTEVERGLIGFDFIRDPEEITAHRR